MSRSPQSAPASAVGVFGGTFDPVHYGHLRAAIEARERLGLDELSLLPAGDPPHRSDTVATARQRLDMLRLATASCPELRVDDREVRRSGPSYMVDTLMEIRAEAGDLPLLLMIGQDAANALDSWHRWRELFDLTHLVVMRRPDAHFDCGQELRREIGRRRVADPDQLRRSPAGTVLALQVTQLDISSTLIRKLFASGQSPRFLMPDDVIAYIVDRQLYKDP